MDHNPHHFDVAAFVEELRHQSQAAFVMMMAARIEQALVWLIEDHMVELNSDMKSRLFTGYGPISTFSAKIDICFALGSISREHRLLLIELKQVRNTFAHSDQFIHFGHEALTKLKNNKHAESLDAFSEAATFSHRNSRNARSTFSRKNSGYEAVGESKPLNATLAPATDWARKMARPNVAA